MNTEEQGRPLPPKGVAAQRATTDPQSSAFSVFIASLWSDRNVPTTSFQLKGVP